MTGGTVAEVPRSSEGLGEIPGFSRRNGNFVDFPHKATIGPRKR
jgi:hypothetical protein